MPRRSRRMSVTLITVSVAVGSAGAAPAGAQEPGCFGALVSTNAHQPASGAANLGQFVSPLAQTVRPFGQIEVPFFKSVACGV